MAVASRCTRTSLEWASRVKGTPTSQSLEKEKNLPCRYCCRITCVVIVVLVVGCREGWSTTRLGEVHFSNSDHMMSFVIVQDWSAPPYWQQLERKLTATTLEHWWLSSKVSFLCYRNCHWAICQWRARRRQEWQVGNSQHHLKSWRHHQWRPNRPRHFFSAFTN